MFTKHPIPRFARNDSGPRTGRFGADHAGRLQALDLFVGVAEQPTEDLAAMLAQAGRRGADVGRAVREPERPGPLALRPADRMDDLAVEPSRPQVRILHEVAAVEHGPSRHAGPLQALHRDTLVELGRP